VTGTHCVQCGAPVGAGAQFCMKCGADVSGQQANLATRTVEAEAVSAPGSLRRRFSQSQLLTRLRDATLGDYEILAELGRGGMATVYLAHDLQLDRKVAIKVLNPGATREEGLVERFRLEARTAAKLSHPNIIPIHAVRESEDLVFFVMKFVVGRPLDSIIKERAPLPIPMTRNILTRVAEALGYAHRHGVVHRDIKPANIMIDAEGRPIVTDFGIAKVVDRERLTMTGTAIGTPTYMSPEQCNAGTITGASDQYSLGVVAYEMLTGRALYEGESLVTVMFKHVHEPPPAPEAFGPGVPADLARAVVRMLQKAPADRWPAMEDALPALRGADASQEDSVRTQMIAFAQGGPQARLLERVSTPRSPIPVGAAATRAASRPPSAEAGGAVPTPPRGRRPAFAVAAVVLAVAAGLAVLRPWAGRADPPVPGRAAVVPGEPIAAAPQSTAPSVPDTAIVPLPAEPEPEPAAAPAPVVGAVQIVEAPSALAEGQTAALRVRVLDQQGGVLRRQARWSSSDSGVAHIGIDGVVRALAPGRATLTADVDGRTARVAVTVTPIVGEVVVTPSGVALQRGDAHVLSAEVRARDGSRLADRPVTWRSSDEGVVVVSSVGRVTAVGVGAVIVSATSEGQVGSARITVSAPAAAQEPARAEPPPAPTATPQELITRLVGAYARALESKDLAQVKVLHPGISATMERRTREALDAMDDLRVQLVPGDITVTGATARARVTGQWIYRGGRLDVNNMYGFERRGDAWVIVSIE
jgi:eukaryotic-like serine/threonine-protein kinase